MDRDLRFYFTVIGLPAIAFAIGGFWLLHVEFVRARAGVEEARHERGEAFARSLQQAFRRESSQDPAARAAVIRAMAADEPRIKGMFLWRKGDGIRWQQGIADEMSATFAPDAKWHANRKKGTGAQRGWFVPSPHEPEIAITWARPGRNEVAGFVVDMSDGLIGGDPTMLFIACSCLVAFLCCSLAAGGWLLVRAARRARVESARKTTFIDNLSHELKVPLAVVRLKAERLLSGKVLGAEKLHAAYQTIANENDAVIRQVDALLDLVRTGKGTRRYMRVSLDLADTVREVATTMADRFPPNGLSVAAHEPVLVHADADAVRQIVRNLLENAAKYAAAKGLVEVEVSHGGGRALVSVADHGDGIPDSQKESVFERFYRIDNDLTRSTGGTGIGLSLARCLARDMGGDVTVADRPGGGCVFTIELPEEKDG